MVGGFLDESVCVYVCVIVWNDGSEEKKGADGRIFIDGNGSTVQHARSREIA